MLRSAGKVLSKVNIIFLIEHLFLSAYSHQIPIVLVLGLSTAITTIHKALSHSVTSLMSIETFYAPTPNDHLLEIIKRVVIFYHLSYQ